MSCYFEKRPNKWLINKKQELVKRLSWVYGNKLMGTKLYIYTTQLIKQQKLYQTSQKIKKKLGKKEKILQRNTYKKKDTPF